MPPARMHSQPVFNIWGASVGRSVCLHFLNTLSRSPACVTTIMSREIRSTPFLRGQEYGVIDRVPSVGLSATSLVN